MNCGIVVPASGWLEMLSEECTAHGTLLVLDEVKTGLTVSSGSATQLVAPSLAPDMVTLGKALGAGLPVAAVGMSPSVAEAVQSGVVDIVSTTGGNRLAMVAAHTGLTQVLTPETYERIGGLNLRLVEGLRRVIEEHDSLQATVLQCGAAKGCIFFADCPTPPKNFREVLGLGEECSELAELCALSLSIHGVWIGTCGDEEWTISAAHDQQDIDAFVAAFAKFARELGEAAPAEDSP
eukprot:TRINITY_DN21075_c0_g1_i1.p1 TRINITY_DN21075_c0_g1~~TRINITY_DN21075_c0_g1_i1.p1  ORF type:complete len:237 (+),score=56.03 TRINITY_DN21075_c0_g1_i1:267-977(+)